MPGLKDLIRLENTAGPPITAGDVTVTPLAQALVLNLGPRRGRVWNRPVAVLVEREGVSRRIPIVDVTRIAQVALIVAGLTTGLSFMLARRRARHAAEDKEPSK